VLPVGSARQQLQEMGGRLWLLSFNASIVTMIILMVNDKLTLSVLAPLVLFREGGSLLRQASCWTLLPGLWKRSEEESKPHRSARSDLVNNCQNQARVLGSSMTNHDTAMITITISPGVNQLRADETAVSSHHSRSSGVSLNSATLLSRVISAPSSSRFIVLLMEPDIVSDGTSSGGGSVLISKVT
jgi:hypothetical protein